MVHFLTAVGVIWTALGLISVFSGNIYTGVLEFLLAISTTGSLMRYIENNEGWEE